MASAFTENQTSLKCRKCRYLLLEQPPHKIVESSASAEVDDYQEASNTFNICDDNLPQWIADAVEEVRTFFQIDLYNNITIIIFREVGPRVN